MQYTAKQLQCNAQSYHGNKIFHDYTTAERFDNQEVSTKHSSELKQISSSFRAIAGTRQWRQLPLLYSFKFISAHTSILVILGYLLYLAVVHASACFLYYQGLAAALALDQQEMQLTVDRDIFEVKMFLRLPPNAKIYSFMA